MVVVWYSSSKTQKRGIVFGNIWCFVVPNKALVFLQFSYGFLTVFLRRDFLLFLCFLIFCTENQPRKSVSKSKKKFVWPVDEKISKKTVGNQ